MERHAGGARRLKSRPAADALAGAVGFLDGAGAGPGSVQRGKRARFAPRIASPGDREQQSADRGPGDCPIQSGVRLHKLKLQHRNYPFVGATVGSRTLILTRQSGRMPISFIRRAETTQHFRDRSGEWRPLAPCNAQSVAFACRQVHNRRQADQCFAIFFCKWRCSRRPQVGTLFKKNEVTADRPASAALHCRSNLLVYAARQCGPLATQRPSAGSLPL